MSLPNFFRGDTKVYSLTFKDGTGTPIPLYGKTLYLTFKSDKGLADADAELTVSLVFPNDANSSAGIGVLQLSADDTGSLDPGKYFYDFQLVDETVSPSYVTTLTNGTVKVLEDVTRRVVAP